MGSNITVTMGGGREERRIELADHSEGKHFKAVICQKLQM